MTQSAEVALRVRLPDATGISVGGRGYSYTGGFVGLE